MYSKRNGAALILVITLSSLLLLAAIGASMYSISDVSLTNDERVKTKLEFACISGLKRAKAKIEESFNNGSIVTLEPEILFQGTTEDDTEKTPEQKAFDDESFTIGSYTDYYTYTYNDESTGEDITVKYSIDEIKDWDRSQSYTTYKMGIEASAYSPKLGWIGMTEEVIARRTTLFMYQVFFENELEIAPGPNFNLTGLIHTNENMYLNANNTLSIYTDSLTSAGNIYRGRLDKNSVGGTVKISSGDEDGTLTSMYKGYDSDNENWTDLATDNWKGSVKDSSLGATRQEAPDLESFEEGGYYDQTADLNINVITTTGKKNKTTTYYEITYEGQTQTVSESAVEGYIEEVSIYDNREYDTSRTVSLTEINVSVISDLIKNLFGTSGYPENGLIYLSREDAVADSDGDDYSADSNRNVSGFKLTNGSELDGASTFVTELPLYIEGDFNLHTSQDAETDTWQPCAVISDAITLLSNSWDDSDSKYMTNASDTTINTVFITGNVPTKTGQYSGGLENFPRFLENWSGVDANISGGFIQLFRSKYATGLWNGSYYNPPNRNWGSEERFLDLDSLPPGYADLFPSTNLGVAYSNWKQISKDNSLLADDNE